MPERDMLSLGVMGMGAGPGQNFFRRRRRRRRRRRPAGGGGGGISEIPIILEKSSNLLGLRVYTVKNAKKSKKCFLSYDLPDSADRSVSRRRYYRNSREIMGLREKIKYSILVGKTQKSVKNHRSEGGCPNEICYPWA